MSAAGSATTELPANLVGPRPASVSELGAPALRGRRWLRLITFRWNGGKAASCHRIAFVQGRGYLRARASSPLLERIWNQPLVGIAVHGEEPAWADARVLPPEEEAIAIRALGRIRERLARRGDALYVELRPR